MNTVEIRKKTFSLKRDIGYCIAGLLILSFCVWDNQKQFQQKPSGLILLISGIVIILWYGNKLRIELVNNLPVLIFSPRELEFADKNGAIIFQWKDIEEWSVEPNDKQQRILRVRSGYNIKSLLIEEMDMEVVEIEILMHEYISNDAKRREPFNQQS